jgi:hypothetical protein
MEDAIKWKQEHESDSFRSIALQFKVNRTTLSRHWNKQQKSMEEHNAFHRGKLNLAQEAELVQHIDRLSLRGCPPTHSMLRNFAREISGKSIGKNWSFRFVNRYRKPLNSGFLHALEIARKRSESIHNFKAFFDQVCTAL